MSLWWLLPIAVLVSGILTRSVRRYALSRSLLDTPNARSSHTVPTPRGGGVAIVVTFLLALSLLIHAGALSVAAAIGLGGSGALVALIGFWDDHGHIPARWRLLGHFIAAFWGVFWLGSIPSFEISPAFPFAEWLGYIVVVIALVWLLNLYNFMDGIDGIASVEAVTVCIGAAICYWLSGFAGQAFMPLLLAASVLGFLFWNFPRARIFMGDAGSGFLGVTLGLLCLQAGWVAPQLLWAWLILLGVFTVDATWTLLRRLLNGEKVYEAHRSHAYQYATRRLGSHLYVTLSVAVINVFWLLPISLLTAMDKIPALVGLLTAYIPLMLLAYALDAGKQEHQEDSTAESKE